MLDSERNGRTARKRLLIEAHEPSPAEAQEEARRRERQGKLFDLIEALGGSGQVQVYRVSGSKNEWQGSLAVDQAATENFEQVIADAYGGGSYQVQFRDGAKYLGSVNVHLSPAIKSVADRERQGKEPDPGLLRTDDVRRLVADTVRQALAEILPRREDSSLELVRLQNEHSKQLLAIQERAQDRLIEAIRAHGAAQLGPARAEPSLLEQVGTVARVVEAVDGIRGPRDAQFLPKTKGEIMLGLMEKPLERVADRIADRMLGPAEEKKAPAPVPVPIQAAPKPDLPKRDPERPLPFPAGTRKLTQEELKALRKRKEGASAIAAQPPPAPTAGETQPALERKEAAQ